jgi:hypothetical protein
MSRTVSTMMCCASQMAADAPKVRSMVGLLPTCAVTVVEK